MQKVTKVIFVQDNDLRTSTAIITTEGGADIGDRTIPAGEYLNRKNMMFLIQALASRVKELEEEKNHGTTSK